MVKIIAVIKPYKYILVIFIALIACSNPTNKKLAGGKLNINLPSIHPSILQERWYTADCHTLCDEEKGIFLDSEKIELYGMYNSYNIQETLTPDSAIISFDFISDCCRAFIGEVQLVNNTLILSYSDKATTYLCDCYCDYRIKYWINKKGKNWKRIRIIYR